MSNIIHIQNEQALTSIFAEKTKTLLIFSASWCGPCRMLAPILEELATDSHFSDVSFVKVDVDQAQELSRKYQINSLPTLVFLQNGEIVDRSHGFMAKPVLAEKITQILG